MKGNCNCGKITFEVTGKTPNLYQCHCILCQKQSGSASNTATLVNESDFNWCSGEDSITHWRKETGFTSDFCMTCGSPVPNRLRDSGYYWIPMGLVGNSEGRIIANICCSFKSNWDLIEQQTQIKLNEMPESVESFVKQLHQ